MGWRDVFQLSICLLSSSRLLSQVSSECVYCGYVCLLRIQGKTEAIRAKEYDASPKHWYREIGSRRAIDNLILRHHSVVSHIPFVVADPHILDLDDDDANVAAHAAAGLPRPPGLGLAPGPPEGLGALVVRVLLEVLVVEELLLVGAGRGDARGACYGRADARALGVVEVEEEGGEAGGGLAGRGAAGGAAVVI